MLSVRMRLVLLIVCLGVAEIKAASIKKSIKESSLKPEKPVKPSHADKDKTAAPTTPIPALVAIEIVNGPENNSSAPKNTSKRTIESSLGYGYQNAFGPEPPKKFVIYKYSQQDIPPLSYNQLSSGHGGQANFQNGFGYQFSSASTQTGHQPSVGVTQQHPVYQAPTQYYNPGTTLYTTVSNQGQLGGLSNHVSYPNLGHSSTGLVPVIILKVYSNQLTNPNTALHTNLPQTHPYSSLNNINLQALLQTYVQQYLQGQGSHYQGQDYQQLYQGHQQTYQVPEEYHSNLPTSENYPSNLHTRVIFHSNNNGHIPESANLFKTAGLSHYKTVSHPGYSAQPSYTNVEVQTPDAQYAYSSGGQSLDQSYMYVYPSQLDQGAYYQQAQNQYQVADSQEETGGHVPPSASQSSPDAPFNYHAHPTGASTKQRRSKKNSVVVSSTLPPKRREPRNKPT